MSKLESIVLGVVFVLKEGCSWRAVDVPGIAWQTIYGHFRRWAKSGLWDQAMQLMKWKSGKSLGTIDSTRAMSLPIIDAPGSRSSTA